MEQCAGHMESAGRRRPCPMDPRTIFVVFGESIVFVRLKPGLLPTGRVLRRRRMWELKRVGGLSAMGAPVYRKRLDERRILCREALCGTVAIVAGEV